MTTTTAPETVAAGAETIPAPTTTDTPVLSILALVSALTGIIFGLVVPLSIVAVVLGILGLQREPRGRTMSIWSIVLGAVPFAFGILAAVVGLAFVVPFGLFWAFGGF
ncbi:putative lysophospholipase L1 biosynthesis ABC-type transport system permease subunit [Microbacteriaceae bacterium SG_E_30_P1]|uniref:Lysophospholipase L1 biosynthesis ABC-type transport system permease subunit n=1 Tax=Antiquaquibacter oligotrophicus TaxID=2880260 RepID=A0ABT6KME1_9MICO|nr:DUF4190 domain-containing protein [Antiquaquibacter oligotrophicus]MDH6181160.1 putative lysophospholipase L1 biosynthesis ABC-type transport system permease subunit [Antiquaquibacter oligotrophicus]UDF13144.1 DUF4190 domain-containing protein [Antiquaquibacter oligotrophicus]